MAVNNKKKTIIIVVVAVIVIAIVVAVLLGIVIPTIKTNQTKERLSQIDAKELQTKIINKLENSPLNINTETTKTEFRILDGNKTSLEAIIEACYDVEDIYNEQTIGKTLDKPYQYFISAFITNTENDSIGVAIPCFSIQSDSNGNLKSIECMESIYECAFIEKIIKYEIKNVLETEYDIDTSVISDLRYENDKDISFTKNTEKINLKYNNEEFLINTFETISNNMSNEYGTYRFKTLTKEKDSIGEYTYNIDLDTLILTIN